MEKLLIKYSYLQYHERNVLIYLFFISYFLPIKILYSSLYNSPTKTHIFCIVKYKTKSENDGCISRDHFSLTIEKKKSRV